jgi:hypothetical protein
MWYDYSLLHSMPGSPCILAADSLHLKNGAIDYHKLEHRECPVNRIIFVPIDNSIRKCLVVYGAHEIEPHNHPLPKFTKAPLEVVDKYELCIDAVGTIGATVQKVDSGIG